jgi:hypothetical protein
LKLMMKRKSAPLNLIMPMGTSSNFISTVSSSFVMRISLGLFSKKKYQFWNLPQMYSKLKTIFWKLVKITAIRFLIIKRNSRAKMLKSIFWRLSESTTLKMKSTSKLLSYIYLGSLPRMNFISSD